MTTPTPTPVMTLEETKDFLKMELLEEKKVEAHYNLIPPWQFQHGIHDRQIEKSLLRQRQLSAALHHLEAGKRGVLKKASELTPEDSALPIFCLPLGMVLVGPSDSEKAIIELYAKHRQQTQDPWMIGVTSSPQPSQQEGQHEP